MPALATSHWPWMQMYIFMRNPKASLSLREIVGSRSVESNPSCCRAERSAYLGKLDVQQDLMRNLSSDG